jgi:hypothetical protein
MRFVDPETYTAYRLFFEYDSFSPVYYYTESGREVIAQGSTLAILTEEENGHDVHEVCAEAVCSQYDQFDKAKGRVVALRKLSPQLSHSLRTAMWNAVRASGMKLSSVPQRRM